MPKQQQTIGQPFDMANRAINDGQFPPESQEHPSRLGADKKHDWQAEKMGSDLSGFVVKRGHCYL